MTSVLELSINHRVGKGTIIRLLQERCAEGADYERVLSFGANMMYVVTPEGVDKINQYFAEKGVKGGLIARIEGKEAK